LELLAALGKELHRDLVGEDADHICRRFFIDAKQAWRVAYPDSAGILRADGDGDGDAGVDSAGSVNSDPDRGIIGSINLSLSYADVT
jgi:hypothetical protein